MEGHKGGFITHTFDSQGSRLQVILVGITARIAGEEAGSLLRLLKEEFEQLAAYLQQPRQTIYISDTPGLTNQKNFSDAWWARSEYPMGECINHNEIFAHLPSWQVIDDELTELFSHELHHLARRQRSGSLAVTLGDNILAEGTAMLYGSLRSTIKPPYSLRPQLETIKEALAAWDQKDFDLNRWKIATQDAYAIGYQLARTLYPEDFDLKHSLTLKAEDEVRRAVQKLASGQSTLEPTHPPADTMDYLVLNSRFYAWHARNISYDELIALEEGDSGVNMDGLQIEYKNGPAANPSGKLGHGQSVVLQNRMLFRTNWQ